MSVNQAHQKISEISLLVGAIQHYDQEWARRGFPAPSPFHDEKRHDLINELTELEYRCRRIADGNVPFRVAVVGSYSTGKSSFLNALIGDDLIPTADIPSSAVISHLHYWEGENGKEEFMVAHLKDKSQRELTRSEYQKLNHHAKGRRIKQKNSLPPLNEIEMVRIGLAVNDLRDIEVIDTPGFEAAGESGGDDRVTMDYLNHADALLWLFDAQNGDVRDSERKQLETARACCGDKPIVAIVNKLDQKPPQKHKSILDKFQCSLSDFDVKVLGFSASKAIELRKARLEQHRRLEPLWQRFRDNCLQSREQKALLQRSANVFCLQLGEKREEIALDAEPDFRFNQYDGLLRQELKGIRSMAQKSQFTRINKRLQSIRRNVGDKKRRYQSSLEGHIEEIEQSRIGLNRRVAKVRKIISQIVDEKRRAHQRTIRTISHKFYCVAVESEVILFKRKHFAVLRHAGPGDRSPDSFYGSLLETPSIAGGLKGMVYSYIKSEAKECSSYCQDAANRLFEQEFGAARDFLDSLADKGHTNRLTRQLGSLYAHSAASAADALYGRKYPLSDANLEMAKEILREALSKAIASEKFFDNILEILRWQCDEIVRYQRNQIRERKKLLEQASKDFDGEEQV